MVDTNDTGGVLNSASHGSCIATANGSLPVANADQAPGSRYRSQFLV
jgi:hypothetical protein